MARTTSLIAVAALAIGGGVAGYFAGPPVGGYLRSLQFQSPTLAAKASRRRIPKAERIGIPVVSSEIEAPHQIRITDKPVVSLRVEDIDEYETGEVAPVLSYSAKLSCLNCTKIPDNDVTLKGVMWLSSDWTIAPTATGTLSVQATITGESGEMQTSATMIEVLDKYGLNDTEHDTAAAVLAGIGVSENDGRTFEHYRFRLKLNRGLPERGGINWSAVLSERLGRGWLSVDRDKRLIEIQRLATASTQWRGGNQTNQSIPHRVHRMHQESCGVLRLPQMPRSSISACAPVVNVGE